MQISLNVALAGVCGYGDFYLQTLLADQRVAATTRLVGVIDPAPQQCRWLTELHRRRIPIFPNLQSLLAATEVQLLCVAAPIHLHASLTCQALENGAAVLCEKPLAGSLQDAMTMLDCQRASGLLVSVGFQWSFSRAVQHLKRDIARGLLGRPIRLKSLAYYPRARSYFLRNTWAGRIQSPDGHWILDSPVNNATSHFLHNMLYLLGDSPDTSAFPASVQSELYRVNDIENYDTAALRITTTDNTEILFYTTHASPHRTGPFCQFEFEHAVVHFQATASPEFTARFRDGSTRSYGSPDADPALKLTDTLASLRNHTPPACGIPAALPHALVVAAAQQSASPITPLPAQPALHPDGEEMLVSSTLHDALLDCYHNAILPAESPAYPWARPALAITPPTSDLLIPAPPDLAKPRTVAPV